MPKTKTSATLRWLTAQRNGQSVTATRDHADHVHRLAAEAVGQEPGRGDREQGDGVDEDRQPQEGRSATVPIVFTP